MPNDAKLGLVVGVGLVITVAVVFFRKDMPAAADPAAHSVRTTPEVPAVPPASSGRSRVVEARTGIRTGHSPATAEGRCHTVREGETLFSLAQKFYGDSTKSALILQVNRGRLREDGALQPGTVLEIPDLPEDP
jgi:nucleoid-associated protein YgaU